MECRKDDHKLCCRSDEELECLYKIIGGEIE